MCFWAAHQLDEESLPISGLAETPGFYLPQKMNRMEASSGWEFLSAKNPFQSLDKIARPDDILSRNRRNFWAAEQLQNEYAPIRSQSVSNQLPIGSQEDFSPAGSPKYCCRYLAIGVPHSGQNFSPGSTLAPQVGQKRPDDETLWEEGLSFLSFGQETR